MSILTRPTPDLAAYWNQIQTTLLPCLARCSHEPLSPRLQQLVAILEVVRIEQYVPPVFGPAPIRRGRPPQDRRPISRAFLAKALYNLPTTDLLIDLLRQQPALRGLCGWRNAAQVPSPATFSRAFAEFAAAGLGDVVHAALVQEHVSAHLVMHISRDATEILARQRGTLRPKVAPVVRYKPGRPKKGHERPAEPTRLQKQLGQTVEQSLEELPRLCDKGVKTDSKGHWHFWIGWKAHIDWVDGGLPVNVVTTSAALHDSQVAIPMARRTAQRVNSLYDLMDSAYDAKEIKQVCRELGHVPIINPNRRPAKSIPLEPAAKVRFRERSVSERGNSRLKDAFGCRHLRVRGHAKAHLHVMCGILVLFADQLLKPWASAA